MRQTSINIKKQGFTLIELLISIAVFALVIGAAIGIFTYSMKGKERVNQLKEIEDNARYAMEMMSREIRMARGIPISERNTADYEIDFDNFSGDSVRFCRADSNGTCNVNGDYLARNTTSNNVVTSDRIKITNLIFYVNDFDLTNGPQPRVTISMTVASATDDSVSMDFQITVSPKIY